MKLSKLAAQDAYRWARAEMFFGEGAGTRRKLLSAEIDHKMATIPNYIEAFNKSYDTQNFADHAIKAAKERKRLDRSNIIGRNIRAIARGDARGLSTVIIVGGAAYYIAHETGLDKQIKVEAQIQYMRAQTQVKKTTRKVKAWNAKRKLKSNP